MNNQKEELPPLKYIIQTLFFNNANYILSAIPIGKIQNNQYSNFEYQLHSAFTDSSSSSSSSSIINKQNQDEKLPFIIDSPRLSIASNDFSTDSIIKSISPSYSPLSSSTPTPILTSTDISNSDASNQDFRVCVKCHVTKSYTWRRSKEIKEPNSKKGARICNRCGLNEIKKRKQRIQIIL